MARNNRELTPDQLDCIKRINDILSEAKDLNIGFLMETDSNELTAFNDSDVTDVLFNENYIEDDERYVMSDDVEQRTINLYAYQYSQDYDGGRCLVMKDNA